jgi:hypothetical protein
MRTYIRIEIWINPFSCYSKSLFRVKCSYFGMICGLLNRTWLTQKLWDCTPPGLSRWRGCRQRRAGLFSRRAWSAGLAFCCCSFSVRFCVVRLHICWQSIRNVKKKPSAERSLFPCSILTELRNLGSVSRIQVRISCATIYTVVWDDRFPLVIIRLS